MMKTTVEICNTFNKHAQEYEQAAKIQNEVGQRLFDRLQYLKITPRYVLDLGCGTGLFSRQLKKRYPKAEIIGLDLASVMLKEAKRKQGWLNQWPLVNADMMHLPFATGTFDLIFANQVIHWGQPLELLIRELNRVMNNQGCLMFSTLGPDTFKELKIAWKQADAYAHTNEFLDMHDLGDCLLRERFLDPVVDMELLSVHYSTLKQLLANLKAQGVRNINQQRNEGLTGKHSWEKFEQSYESLRTEAGKYPLTYEIVYGHAWKGSQRLVTKGTETFIPIADILKSPANE